MTKEKGAKRLAEEKALEAKAAEGANNENPPEGES